MFMHPTDQYKVAPNKYLDSHPNFVKNGAVGGIFNFSDCFIKQNSAERNF